MPEKTPTARQVNILNNLKIYNRLKSSSFDKVSGILTVEAKAIFTDNIEKWSVDYLGRMTKVKR